jgi:large subunit ribosomal protein L6
MLQSLLKSINKTTYGVSYGWLFELNLKGINIDAFVNDGFLKFDLGFSHCIIYKIPKNLLVSCHDKKIYIYGINLNEINKIVYKIKTLKPLDSYGHSGIYLRKELLKIKTGRRK